MNKTPVFKPQLSFDGVAIIVVAITFAVWMGVLKTHVEDHAKTLDDHENRIRAEEHEIATIRYGLKGPSPTP